MADRRVTLVSMSGLRVVNAELLADGLRLPGLRRRATALAQLPPLGLLTVAAHAPDDYQVSLHCDDGQVPISDAVDAIIATRPDVVAFSSLTAAANRTYAISNQLRTRGVTTVYGGLHATAVPDEASRYFDAVVVGDGEEAFADVLRDATDHALQPRYQSDAPFDLRRSRLPRWDLIDVDAPPRYTMQTSRGCPWACSFCAASRLLGPPRRKPNDRIAEELFAITSRQLRPWLELADDNTFAVGGDDEGMLRNIAMSGARWFTESDWRIGLRPKLLKSIANAGCRQILIGIESTHFRYPGMGRKHAEFQEMMEATRAIQNAGIVVNACFIVGVDGETQASIDALGDFLCTAPFGEVQLTLQTPFPGTGLFRKLQHAGRLIERLDGDATDWSRHTLFDVTFHPDEMTAIDLQASFAALIARVFSEKQQIRRNQLARAIRSRRSLGTNRSHRGAQR